MKTLLVLVSLSAFTFGAEKIIRDVVPTQSRALCGQVCDCSKVGKESGVEPGSTYSNESSKYCSSGSGRSTTCGSYCQQ